WKVTFRVSPRRIFLQVQRQAGIKSQTHCHSSKAGQTASPESERQMHNHASHGDGYCIAASPPFRNRACLAALTAYESLEKSCYRFRCFDCWLSASNRGAVHLCSERHVRERNLHRDCVAQ